MPADDLASSILMFNEINKARSGNKDINLEQAWDTIRSL
jgi:hypothetical protein